MSDALEQEIRVLRAQYWSARDPEGRAFAPLAEAYRKMGELDEALALVQDGLGRLPDFTSGHLVASRIARDRGEPVASREHLDRVVALDPHNSVALVERATALISDGDSEGGLLDLRAALELEPGNAVLRDRLREMEEAAVTAALELPAEHEVQRGDAGAEDGAATFGGESPAEFMLTRTMGDLYARQGLLDRAVEVYEQLAELNPDDLALAERLSELRGRAESAAGAGEPPPLETVDRADPTPTVTPASTSAPTSEPTIGQYLEDLLAWVPGAVPVASLAPDDGTPESEEEPSGPPHADDTPVDDVGEDDSDADRVWLRSLQS
ncbi:MAG: tetratricopeptide repeat protein [Gemmatimonadota bacterium]